MISDDVRRLEEQCAETTERLMGYERLQEALCPPGMNFTEHINDLQARLAKMEAPLWEGHLTGRESDRQAADHCLTEGIKDDG